MGPEEVKRLRQLLGWSQERLARELNVSFSTVNRWEKGRTTPNRAAVGLLKGLNQTQEDKRCSKRTASRLFLEFLRQHDGATNSSYTENISAGGLMFQTGMGVKTGDSLNIGLRTMDLNEVRISSDVVWVMESGERSRVGVRFKDLQLTDVVRLLEAAY